MKANHIRSKRYFLHLQPELYITFDMWLAQKLAPPSHNALVPSNRKDHQFHFMISHTVSMPAISKVVVMKAQKHMRP